MKSWFSIVREDTENILQAIKIHPFITELMEGTLPKDTFEFYINQDALYLAIYKKVLAEVGIRCELENETQFFLQSATGVLEVETALHQTFLKGVEPVTTPSPSCELYISYLTRMTSTKSVEEGLAAVLPCFTIYKEIGDYILEHQGQTDDNPYQSWIQTYGGEAFAASVNAAIDITNHYAAKAPAPVQAKMKEAFVKSSQLEWYFWDSAYNKETWKV